MPTTIEPMKARLGKPGPGIDWQFEIKWDGYRAIAFCGERFRLQGRRLNSIGSDFPEIAALSDEPAAKDRVFDGELVVFDDQGRPDFQLMQSRREKSLRAHFQIFDLLWSEGEDLRSLSYAERRAALEAIDLAGERWSVPARIDATLEEALEATSQLGLEGLVAKDPDSPYVEGRRSSYWLKVKHVRRQEFVVGGWLPGKGHRSRTLGALLVGYRDAETDGLRFAGRIGTGMDDSLLSQISADLSADEVSASPFAAADLAEIPSNARWAEPRMVIEAKFTEWTRDGRLRNPVFLGFRPDKQPQEVVREEV
jgi:bifunctional non-homologous end joining protein LigD